MKSRHEATAGGEVRRGRTIATRALALLLLGAALGPLSLRVARGDEPGVLSKERWEKLSEVQFAELKGAEDMFRKKTYKAARNAYEKFMTAHTKSDVGTYCQLMMAECTRLSGKPNDAVSDFQFVIDLAPESDDAKWARFRIGQCYKSAGNVEKAASAFAEVWKENGTHPTAFFSAVEQVAILETQRKWKERVPVLEAFIERFDKNRIDREDYARMVHTLARERLFGANVDGAYTLLQSVAKKGEVKGGADSQLIDMGSRIIRELGGQKEADAKARRDKLAQAMVQKAMAWLKEDPKRADHQDLIHTMIGILMETDQKDEAIKQAVEAKKLYDNAQWTFVMITGLYTKLGKPDVAIAQAGEARRVHKDADWALDLYATLVYANKDVEQALAAWDLMKDKLASLTKTSELLAAEGKLKEGIERRRKIYELFPAEESASRMWIAGVLAKAKKFDDAIKEYRVANTEPVNLYKIAECLSHQGKHKEAISQYSEIGAAFETETPNAIYCMALEHEKTGAKDNAINLLRRVCRSYPKSKAASSAHVRLQSKYGIDETLGGGSNENKDGDEAPAEKGGKKK